MRHQLRHALESFRLMATENHLAVHLDGEQARQSKQGNSEVAPHTARALDHLALMAFRIVMPRRRMGQKTYATNPHFMMRSARLPIRQKK
jgi:hypothetical protein